MHILMEDGRLLLAKRSLGGWVPVEDEEEVIALLNVDIRSNKPEDVDAAFMRGRTREVMADKLSERIEIIHPGDPLGNAFWRDDIGANHRIPVPVAEALIALEQQVEELKDYKEEVEEIVNVAYQFTLRRLGVEGEDPTTPQQHPDNGGIT